MKTDNVLHKMQEITENHITTYKTDFYDYDLPRLTENKPSEFVWMIRQSGTHLMLPPAQDADRDYWLFLFNVYASANERLYYCTMNKDGSGTITHSESRARRFAEQVTR